MKSTNYYIVHRSGRRMKIYCLGYIHSGIEKEKMRLHVAEVEGENADNYLIADENEFAGMYLGPDLIRPGDVSKRVSEFLKLPILRAERARITHRVHVKAKQLKKLKRDKPHAKEYNNA